jgi:hypothetical protein
MLSTWQLALSLQIALVAVPVAVYFLVLGLLNSQNRPQVLSGRLDFALLIAAFSPLCVVPLLNCVGASVLTVLAALAVVAGLIAVLAPRPHETWVLYNISKERVLRCVERALDASGIACVRQGDRITLQDGPVISMASFPLLRNVSIHVSGGKQRLGELRRFEAELARSVGRIEVAPSPMAVSFVLISTAMIVAPLILMADRVPEMVRILTDLMY